MSLPIRRWEILLWCLASLALTAYQLGRTSGPRLSYDSYQYLNIAHHLASQGSAQTSIIHFDEERAQGRVPAPVSHFPIGYPALVAGLRLLGLNLETAALAISITATVGIALLMVVCAGLLAFSPGATRTALLLWTFNSQVAEFSVSVLSEPLSTVLSLAAVVLLVSGETSSRGIVVVMGCILVGLSFWVRYSGFLLIASVGLYGAVRYFQNRQRQAWLCGGTMVGAIVGAAMLRNLVLAGTWQGVTTKKVFHPMGEVLRTFTRAIYHLFFGDATVLAPVVIAFFVAGSIAALISVTRRSGVPRWGASALALLGVYGAVYSLGMINLGMFSVISFGTRMFFPLLPILILLAAAWGVSLLHGAATVGRTRRLTFTAAAVLGIGGYVLLNARSLARPLSPAPHEEMARRLNRPMQDSLTLRYWMERHIPVGQTIVASEGQALAYLTNRPVVSLASSAFSSQVWDEAAVQAIMRRYEASYLMVYPGASAAYAPVQSQSPFLAALSRDVAPETPPWLNLVADNGLARVFHCPHCPPTALDSLFYIRNSGWGCQKSAAAQTSPGFMKRR